MKVGDQEEKEKEGVEEGGQKGREESGGEGEGEEEVETVWVRIDLTPVAHCATFMAKPISYPLTVNRFYLAFRMH